MTEEKKWKVIEDDKPEQDDNVWNREGTIEGVYKKKEEDVGPNKSRMYTFETKDGDLKVWGSTVLDGRMDKIPLGANVRIESLGKPAGKNYYNFIVSVEDLPEGTKAEDTKVSEIPF